MGVLVPYVKSAKYVSRGEYGKLGYYLGKKLARFAYKKYRARRLRLRTMKRKKPSIRGLVHNPKRRRATGVNPYLKRVIRKEIHKHDKKIQCVPMDSAWSNTVGNQLVYVLGQDIRKGDNIDERTGNTIHLSGVRLYCDWRSTQTGAANFPTVRLLVLRDKKPAIGASDNLFEYGGPGAYQPQDFTSVGNLNQLYMKINHDRYTVIKDFSVKLLPMATGESGKNQRNFYKWVPINKTIRFSTDTDTGSTNKIFPNYKLMAFVEKQDSSNGVTFCTAKIQVKHYFSG